MMPKPTLALDASGEKVKNYGRGVGSGLTTIDELTVPASLTSAPEGWCFQECSKATASPWSEIKPIWRSL